MDSIIVILLVVAVIKFFFFGGILSYVFRDDFHEWREGRKAAREGGSAGLSSPVCMYCGSPNATALDEGASRWEDSDLVLVTTYHCPDCEMPFWHVERVPVGTLKS